MRILLFRLSVICTALFVFANANAGGPFAVDSETNSGVALRWINDNMEWYADDGPLSASVDNAVAKERVQKCLGRWTSITLDNAERKPQATATITTTFKGNVGKDITKDNYKDFIAEALGKYDSKEMRTTVIFDDNGDIIADLVGEANRNLVLGLTQPLRADTTGLYIIKGFTLFNGLLQSNGKLSSDQAVADELFDAAMTHELGHLLNLDHSQSNLAIAKACKLGQDCADGNHIPTMYPQLLVKSQGNLTFDDMITLSWIYPTDAFKKDFCTITGEIFDANNVPLKQVNVIATRVGEGDTATKVDTRSFVSGAFKPECVGDAKYYLYGIVPGRKYRVTYESIDPAFTSESGFQPLPNKKPPQFKGGDILSPGGETTVACEKGGDVIEMASVNIDVSNLCTPADQSKGDEGAEKGQTSSARCSLGASGGSPLEAGLLALAALLIVRQRMGNSRKRGECARLHFR